MVILDSFIKGYFELDREVRQGFSDEVVTEPRAEKRVEGIRQKVPELLSQILFVVDLFKRQLLLNIYLIHS